MRKLPVLPALLLLFWGLSSCGPQSSPPPVAVAPEAPTVEPVAPGPETPEPQVSAPPPPEKKAVSAPPPPTAVVPGPVTPELPVTPAPVIPVPPEPAAPVAPEVPATPPPAPELKLDPVVFQATSATLKPGPLPPGTVVRYTLDGSDPAGGKPWPASGLVVSQSGRVRVWAAQSGGDAATAEVAVTIGEVWVQAGASGEGSWTQPVGTLDAGLTKALALGVTRVRLVSGTLTTKTDLAGTWDLSGGWKGPGEPGAATVITGTKQSGSTQKEPSYTLKVSPGAKVTLAGLEVRSPNASFGAAVLVEKDASVEVNKCRLIGGNGLYGYGLKASGASAVTALDSWFYGGDGGSSFALSAEKSAVKVVRSTLDAGTGNAVSYGINLTLSSLTLVSSVVWGGAANSSYGVGLYSSTSCSLLGSTLLGGRGSSAWALYLSETEPEIAGCLIGASGKVKSYGIFANYGKSLPKSLRSNAFFGSSSGAFAGASLGEVSSQPGDSGAFLDPQGNALPGQKANLKADVSVGPGPDFKTLGSSSAAVLKGSEPLTGEAALDRAGKPRGASPSFGAWAISP